MMARIPVLVICLIATVHVAGAPAAPAPIVELIEDHPEPLLAQLEGQGGGQGIIETRDVFSGKASVRIIPLQRFRRDIPGWAYRITADPRPGEYRFVRWAWRGDGTRGLMLQMHDDKDWNIRFTAGADEANWGTKFVAPAAPATWTVVTRDLFAEFGERTIHGIALTVFGGTAGYFDHIYLGRTIDDLDRIDATGLRDAPAPRLSPGDLDRCWAELAGDDAPRAYRAFWMLAAAPEQSVPFIRLALSPPNSPEAVARVKRWIADLSADDFALREEATRQLLAHREGAAGLMAEALRGQDLALEARIRVEQILKSAAPALEEPVGRVEKGVRILAYADTPEAATVVEEWAKGDPALPVTRAAVEARKRLADRREK